MKNSLKPNRILHLIADFKTMIITYMPGSTGQIIRYNYYKKHLKHLGRNVTFDPGIFILNPGYVSIGDNTWIDKYVILLAGIPCEGKRKIYKKPNPNFDGTIGELTIGKNNHIAPYVLISASWRCKNRKQFNVSIWIKALFLFASL